MYDHRVEKYSGKIKLIGEHRMLLGYVFIISNNFILFLVQKDTTHIYTNWFSTGRGQYIL